MFKKIAVAFAALVLLSACSSNSARTKFTSELDRVGAKVHFAFNSSELSAESKAILAEQAKLLKGNETFNVIIEGHCDVRGTREYNIALGERRADAVKRFLIAHGIKLDRVDTISYGKEKPESMGDNTASHARNRRAVTVAK